MVPNGEQLKRIQVELKTSDTFRLALGIRFFSEALRVSTEGLFAEPDVLSDGLKRRGKSWRLPFKTRESVEWSTPNCLANDRNEKRGFRCTAARSRSRSNRGMSYAADEV